MSGQDQAVTKEDYTGKSVILVSRSEGDPLPVQLEDGKAIVGKSTDNDGVDHVTVPVPDGDSTHYLDGDGNWTVPPGSGGGGGIVGRASDIFGGVVVVTGEQAIDSSFQGVVDAELGDLLEVTLSTAWASSADTAGRMCLATMVGGSPVTFFNEVAGDTVFTPSYVTIGASATAAGGSFTAFFVVQADDLSAGTVTIRPYVSVQFGAESRMLVNAGLNVINHGPNPA